MRRLSGRRGHNIKVPLLKGWILNFFAYFSEIEDSFHSKDHLLKKIILKLKILKN